MKNVQRYSVLVALAFLLSNGTCSKRLPDQGVADYPKEQTPADSGIPSNLDAALRVLDKEFSASDKAEFKAFDEEEMIVEYHMSTGLWIRNHWRLWAGSPLSEYFVGMGISHPDDMSGIILTSYHRKLNGKAIRLDEQVKDYKDYWTRQKAEWDGIAAKALIHYARYQVNTPIQFKMEVDDYNAIGSREFTYKSGKDLYVDGLLVGKQIKEDTSDIVFKVRVNKMSPSGITIIGCAVEPGQTIDLSLMSLNLDYLRPGNMSQSPTKTP